MKDVLDTIAARTTLVVDALEDADLDTPSALPGWSRLTIACHLRYGGEALRRMTEDTVAGRPTSYYPEGRDAQRPATLLPQPGESHADVVASLRESSAALDATFAGVCDWTAPVIEPEGVFPSLDMLAILRLTEVEVHGTDLDLGLPPWSDVLVRHALPRRLDRLRRRTPEAPGAWLVAGVRVGDDSEPELLDVPDRELFALLLGRSSISESFRRAFPGP